MRHVVVAIVIAVTCGSFVLAQADQQNALADLSKTESPVASPSVEVLSDTSRVDLSPYLNTVIRTVQENWYALIPAKAHEPEKKQGKVSIEFSILRDGKITGAAVASSSGDEVLDRAALASILASSPLPALPAKITAPRLALRLHFQYNPVNPQSKPQTAEAQYNLGVTLQEKGDLEGAIAAYHKALALKPKFAEALANLGMAQSSRGEVDEAIRAFQEALKLNPDNAKIHVGLGVALRRKGDEEAANREFQQARRLDPKQALPAPRSSLPMIDDFSGECGWPRGEMENFSYGCVRDGYRMQLKKPGPVHVTRSFGLETHAVAAQVNVTVTSGRGTEPGKAMLGVGCIVDDEHGYVAILKTDGAWGILRLQREFIPLAGSNQPGVSLQSSGATIGIECDASNEKASVISLFVDGQRVAASVDNRQGYRWFNGFALYADTFPGDVVFERFTARRPPPQ